MPSSVVGVSVDQLVRLQNYERTRRRSAWRAGTGRYSTAVPRRSGGGMHSMVRYSDTAIERFGRRCRGGGGTETEGSEDERCQGPPLRTCGFPTRSLKGKKGTPDGCICLISGTLLPPAGESQAQLDNAPPAGRPNLRAAAVSYRTDVVVSWSPWCSRALPPNVPGSDLGFCPSLPRSERASRVYQLDLAGPSWTSDSGWQANSDT